MEGRKIPIKVGARVVGWYYLDAKVYVKYVDYYKHHSFLMHGWGIQTPLIAHLRKLGCRIVRMYVTKSGERYILYTQFQNYIDHGITPDPPLNPLDGLQTFLRDEHWKRGEWK